MLDLIFSIFSYLIIFISVIYLSRKLKFYDYPNRRKLHKNKITNTSGIALYIYLGIMVSTNEFSYEIETIIVVGSAVVITGFLDDRTNLTPGVKLVLIFLPVSYLILNGYQMENLGTYEYLNRIDLGKFGIIFTFLSVGLLLNSYNYIDGIDGLLSSITITGILYLIFLETDQQIIKLLQYFIIALSINLIFNFLSGSNYFKTFLGDSGSLFIGFFMSFLIIFMFKFRDFHPAYLIWVCWYPVYDFLYVTFYRISKGVKFYKADKKHLHHIIIEKFKKSHLKSCILISILNIFIITLGYLTAHYVGKIYSLVMFILLFVVFWFIRYRFQN